MQYRFIIQRLLKQKYVHAFVPVLPQHEIFLNILISPLTTRETFENKRRRKISLKTTIVKIDKRCIVINYFL